MASCGSSSCSSSCPSCPLLVLVITIIILVSSLLFLFISRILVLELRRQLEIGKRSFGCVSLSSPASFSLVYFGLPDHALEVQSSLLLGQNAENLMALSLPACHPLLAQHCFVHLCDRGATAPWRRGLGAGAAHVTSDTADNLLKEDLKYSKGEAHIFTRAICA